MVRCSKDRIAAETLKKLTYEGPVVSIEDLPDINSNQASSKYWIVPYDDMKSFFSFEHDYYYAGELNFTVQIPIFVDEVRKI